MKTDKMNFNYIFKSMVKICRMTKILKLIHCTLIGLLDISGWEVYSGDQKATHISMRTQQNYSLEFSCESYKPAIYCTSAIQRQ